MDTDQSNLILKKRLNTCRTSTGRLSKIPDDLIIDVVRAWERWPGTGKSFYTALGLTKDQLGPILKKGKRLFKEGKDKLGPFTPIETPGQPASPGGQKVPMIVQWDKKKSIRFYQVNHLIDFLKKCA